jgi:hypothetical protein
MKIFRSLLTPCLALIMLTGNSIAQAPEGFNYQAIARSNTGLVLPNQHISLRLTITDGNGGTILYQEVQSVTTNQFGLFTITIGSINPSYFATIAWGSSIPWLHVEMDPNGGTTYTDMGSSQLLSVPYALYAAKSSGGISSNSVFGTSQLNITTGTTNFVNIPGLSQEVTLAADGKALISTFGGFYTTSVSSTGYSAVSFALFIDGTQVADGGYERIVALNAGTVGNMSGFWSMTQTEVLTAGTHQVEIMAKYAQGSAAVVSGDNTAVTQGVLTVTVINQ